MTPHPGKRIFSAAEVEEMRRLWDLKLMTMAALAEKYHCSKRTIGRIVKRQLYQEGAS